MKWQQLFCAVCFVCMLTACDNEKPQVSQPETDPQIQTQTETAKMETDEADTTQNGNMEEKSESTEENAQISEANTNVEGDVMKITVGNTTFTATLADNSSVATLKELLMEDPLTINMSDYGNMEKVGPIGTSLPRNNEQITTGAGDIILYQGNSLVIYYDTNSWNFTRLGKINDVTQEELKEILGEGDITVTLTLE